MKNRVDWGEIKSGEEENWVKKSKGLIAREGEPGRDVGKRGCHESLRVSWREWSDMEEELEGLEEWALEDLREGPYDHH